MKLGVDIAESGCRKQRWARKEYPQCTMGNQGIIGDIGYLYMENVGFGLIFDGK